MTCEYSQSTCVYTCPSVRPHTAVYTVNYMYMYLYSHSLSFDLLLSLSSPAERTEEDIELIYEELIHIGAFRHLSNAVSSPHLVLYLIILK